jgi:hypothetical protein
LVHEFVIQVFLQRGDFWHGVRDLRVRWNVAAETLVPPISNAGVYRPPECDRSVSSGLEGTEGSSPAALKRWQEDLGALHDRFVPSKCRTGARDSASRENWERCLSALVLYDPPETQLLEFADRLPLSPVTLCPHCKEASEVPRGSSFNREEILRALSDPPFMVAPPIEYLRDSEEVQKAVDAHWRRVIDELASRLEPRGLDISAMVEDILRDERIQAEGKKRTERTLPKPYIVLDEFTTDEDASRARSMIASVHGWDSKG